MPARSRWLKTWMAMPARTRSATMPACRSEKASTRSGSSARIFGMSAETKADTRGFSRLRRTDGIAGDADDAVLLAEQIERFDRLLGQADDAAGREVAHGETICANAAAVPR